MVRRIVSLFVFAFFSLQNFAQDLKLYEKQWFEHKGDTMPYRVLLPENYDASKKYPFILFLHGAGERGNDNEKQLMHGAKLFLSEEFRKKYPAIVVFPQCAEESYWSNRQTITDSSGNRELHFLNGGEPTKAMVLVQALVKDLAKKYPLDKSQYYVGGLSMGGMGTFEIVRRNPRLFVAAFPICGGAAPGSAEKLKNVHWWVFHGDKDNVVSIKHSEEMVEALKKINASVKFTVYPGVGHNSWDNTFAEPELIPWLFSHKK